MLFVHLPNWLCLYFNVDCAVILCLRPDCDNPTTPPGRCCSICPPTIPTLPPTVSPPLPTLIPPSKCCQFDG